MLIPGCLLIIYSGRANNPGFDAHLRRSRQQPEPTRLGPQPSFSSYFLLIAQFARADRLPRQSQIATLPRNAPYTPPWV